MTYAIFEDLLHNAALLLLIVYIYDLVSSSWHWEVLDAVKIPVGIAMGLIGIGVMLSPLDMGPGVIYDTRSVLLGISGLFFGALPTLIAMAMTAAFRIHLGGVGMWTGVAVIFACGFIGLLWRHYRRDQLAGMRLRELYVFGLMVQFAMLLLQLTLPDGRGPLVLSQIVVPVLLVFPPAMTMIGALIISRIRREQQSEALVTSERHLQALYQHAPVALWKEDFSLVKQALDEITAAGHTDLEAYLAERPAEAWRLARLVRIIDLNEAGLRQVGAASVSEVTRSLDRIFTQESMAAFTRELIALTRGEALHDLESSIVRLDGELRHHQVSFFVIPGHTEKLDLVVVSTVDVTDNKNYENELRQSHAMLCNLTDQAPGVIYQYRLMPDGSSSFPYASKGIEQVYEVTADAIMNDASTVFERIHPDDLERVRQSILVSARTLQPWQCDYRVCLPLSGVRWVSGSAIPTRQADGSVLWHGYLRDATEAKNIEQRLQLTSKVFDAAGEGVLITDRHQNIIAVNSAFSRVTGFSEADVLGQKPSILSSGRHDASFYRNMWAALESNGTWAGDVWNRRKSGEVYPEWLTISAVKDDLGELHYYVAVFSDLSEIRRAQNLADRLAMEDVLTGLANRSAFILRMDRFLGELRGARRHSAMIMFDLDRFKEINQNEGLARGDAVLKSVASSLQQCFGSEHLVARVGADEFAVLVYRQVGTREEAGRIALEAFEQAHSSILANLPAVGSGGPVEISAGIVILPGEAEEQTADILQAADWAASQAKAQGGGRAIFFASVMGQEIRERYRLEQDLRQSVQRSELRLFLQPQVNAAGVQVSAEALIRWQHPQRGLIPPGMFITLAEESGFISTLERWMLREICQLLGRLEVAGRSLKISLNISARHFERDDFVDEVRRQVSQSGIDPSCLVFEITESVVIENMGAVTEKMLNLGALGIHFSLDDFGTGYSSLSYLKRLPIQELKIDRSFITDAPNDPNDAALVETILGVARTLHLRVVAEGVETRAQADFLNARGEVLHQGYLYDKPMPVAQWLEKYFNIHS